MKSPLCSGPGNQRLLISFRFLKGNGSWLWFWRCQCCREGIRSWHLQRLEALRRAGSQPASRFVTEKLSLGRALAVGDLWPWRRPLPHGVLP